MEQLFKDWLDNPLARLGRQPHLVVERPEKISKKNGPYIANGSMRSLRPVYNHAQHSPSALQTVLAGLKPLLTSTPRLRIRRLANLAVCRTLTFQLNWVKDLSASQVGSRLIGHEPS